MRVRFNHIVLLLSCTLLHQRLKSQTPNVYTIKADSVKITNCDSAELIIENHTQGVPGFLFNTGNGRTRFQRAAIRLNDTTYLVGADTVKLPNAWVQGGNAFGTTGVLGTLDNNHLDFYTNSQQRMRLTNSGDLLLGATYDNGNKVQIVGQGAILINPVLSTRRDMIKIGGYNNPGDGQDIVISASADSGNTYYQVLVARDGYVGLGYGSTSWIVGSPPIRILPGGIVSMQTPAMYFGNTGGPYNASALITAVSNTNEWNENLNNYPNGQNYYYFGTALGTPQPGYMRAPLRIGARDLRFMTGGTDTQAVMISEGQDLLVGTSADSGYRLQVNGSGYVSGSVRFAGLTLDSTQTRVLVSDANGNLYYRSASSLAIDEPLRSSLAVNGPITAKSLRLSATGWPDYVFDSAYALPSLQHLENYIRENNHLPGLPAAASAEKEGVDVGTTQAALLKKIEELTLYVIQQDHEIKALRKQVDRMNKQHKTQK